MRVYFYSKKINDKSDKGADQVLDILRKTDLEVESNLLSGQGSTDISQSFIQAGLSVFSQFDSIILEVSEIDQQVNYILAQAVLQKKPLLCLYQKNRPPRSLLMFLKQKHIPRMIKIKAYTPDSLQKTIFDFLRTIQNKVEEIEIPSIRFTLRLTPQLDKYLNFVTKGKKISKADYLRNMLKDKMQNDKKFNK